MLTPAQAAFLAALPQRPSTFNPYRDPRGAQARQKRIIGRMRDLGYLSPGDATDRARRTPPPLARAVVFVAPHFVEMVLSGSSGRTRSGGGATGSHRHDARRGLQRDVQGIIAARARRPRQGRRAQRRGRRARQRDGRLARVGGLGQLSGPEHGGAINGVLDAASAGIGAEAVHLRARLRGRPRSVERAGRRAVALSDGRTGRALQPAQLRRALPRSAARAAGARRLGERAGGRAARPTSACPRWCASCVTRASRRSTRPRRTTASA